MSASTRRSPGRISTRRAPGKGGPAKGATRRVQVEPADHALGRSRGGWTTKLQLGCEQGRKPLAILVTAGQRGDSPQFAAVVERIRVPRQGGPPTDPTRSGPGRQGVQLEGQPSLPAPTRDQGDYPDQG